MQAINFIHNSSPDFDSFMKGIMVSKEIKFGDKIEFINNFMVKYCLNFLDVISLMPTQSIAALSANYFSEPNLFSTFIERNVRLTNQRISVADNKRIFGKEFYALKSHRTSYEPIISLSAHYFFVEEILPLGLHHLLLSEGLDLSQVLKNIEYDILYKELSEPIIPSQRSHSPNTDPKNLSNPSTKDPIGVKIENSEPSAISLSERRDMELEEGSAGKNHEVDAMKYLVSSPYIYGFMSKMASKDQEKLKSFEEKLKEIEKQVSNCDEYFSSALVDVLRNSKKIAEGTHFEIFINILMKKTKRALFNFIINKKKGLELLNDFESKIDRNKLAPYLSEVISSEKNHLEIAKRIWFFIDSIKKSNNNIFILKNAVCALRFFHCLFIKKKNSKSHEVHFNIPNNSNMTLLARTSLWTLTKLLLYINQSDVSLVIVNYLLRNFEEIFQGPMKEDISKYIHIFFCFQYIFHRDNEFTERSELVICSQKSIQLLLERLLVLIDSNKFLEKNFYFNINYEDLVFDENMKAIYEGFEFNEKTLEMITVEIKEDKNFQEKMILILAFLKHLLSDEQIRPKFKKTQKNMGDPVPWNLIEDKHNTTVMNLYSSLMMIPGIDDSRKLSKKFQTSNHNVVSLVKNRLLIECFGKLGAYDQSAFIKSQNKSQEIINRNSRPKDLANYVKKFLDKNIFFMETPMSVLFSSYDKLGRVIEAPHNYISTQGIEERIEVEDDSEKGIEGEFNILKWVCRLALNLSNEYKHVFDAMLELIIENTDFAYRLMPFLIHNFLSSVNKDGMTALAKNLDSIFKKGNFLHRKICTHAFGILESWYIEEVAESKEKYQKFCTNFNFFREMITKDYLIDSFEKNGEYKKAIYYLEKMIDSKISEKHNGDEIARDCVRLFEFYKITNEDFQNLQIEKILKKLKIEYKNIVPELQLQQEENKKNELWVKEILTDSLNARSFYKDLELFNGVQYSTPDFSRKNKIFYDFMRILVSSTLVIVSLKEDCLEQRERLISQQRLYIESIKKGLATQIANAFGRYDESFSFFVKIQVLTDLETFITLLLYLDSSKIRNFNLKREPLKEEPISQSTEQKEYFSLDQLSDDYLMKQEGFEFLSQKGKMAFITYINRVILLMWRKLKTLSLIYHEKFLYLNLYKYLVFLMLKKAECFRPLYAKLLFKLMKFCYHSNNIDHAKIYYSLLKIHKESLKIQMKYNFLSSKLLFKKGKYSKSIQRLKELTLSEEKNRLKKTNITIPPRIESILKHIENEAKLKRFSYMIKSGLYCVQSAKNEFDYLISKPEVRTEKMYFKYAKMLDKAYPKPPLELLQKIIELYCSSIEKGNKYFYQSFPKVIRLWLDNYVPSALRQNNPPKEKEVLSNILRRMRNLLLNLPEEKLVYVTHLLISRVEHDDNEVAFILCQSLARIADKYPEQSIWWLLPLNYFDYCNSEGTRKKQKRYEQIMDLLEKSQKLSTLKKIKEAEPFYRFLLELSQKKEISLVKYFQPKNMIVPCRENLFPKMRSDSDSVIDLDIQPFPNEPVYITGIESKTIKIDSKEKPIKISLICSNNKSKHYLLKFEKKGDMRKEARTMDLFNFINDLFKRDENTLQRNFEVGTYYIVPMCSNIVLIEWCDDTVAIKQLITDIWNKKKLKLIPEHIITMHKEKKLNFDMKTIHPKLWEELKEVPPVFSEYFLSNYNDINVWYDNTLNYIKTTAIWCAIGYLIGIGDRHSENMLLERSTAKVIHIDFDCIFEKGKTLPVPEIVPFRLTNNIEKPFGVFKSYSLFHFYMVLALQFFRKNIENIIGALDCFLIDPLQEQTKLDVNTNIIKIREKADMRNFKSVEELVDSLIQTSKSDESLKLMYFAWMPYL